MSIHRVRKPECARWLKRALFQNIRSGGFTDITWNQSRRFCKRTIRKFITAQWNNHTDILHGFNWSNVWPQRHRYFHWMKPSKICTDENAENIRSLPEKTRSFSWVSRVEYFIVDVQTDSLKNNLCWFIESYNSDMCITMVLARNSCSFQIKKAMTAHWKRHDNTCIFI